MGRHLSPRYGQVILVSGYPVLTAVNWSQHWCAICVQYQSSCAPKLARKCGIEHWFPCGADGRAAGGRCTVKWLPNFLGWVDLLTHGAQLARANAPEQRALATQRAFARQSSAINVGCLAAQYSVEDLFFKSVFFSLWLCTDVLIHGITFIPKSFLLFGQ